MSGWLEGGPWREGSGEERGGGDARDPEPGGTTEEEESAAVVFGVFTLSLSTHWRGCEVDADEGSVPVQILDRNL